MMERPKVSKLQDQFDIEKQVFPNCIQVRRQYTNKRKSSQGMTLQDYMSPKWPDENDYPGLRDTTPQLTSASKVAEWLQTCEHEMPGDRQPFSDLDPNTYLSKLKKKKTGSKMQLRSSGIKIGSKNTATLCPGNYHKLPESNILPVSQLMRNEPKSIRHQQSFSNKSMAKKEEKANNYFQFRGNVECGNTRIMDMEVSGIGAPGLSNDDEPITIEDSEEICVDKDYLACLAVERAEAFQAKEALPLDEDVRQFEPPSADVRQHLMELTGSLREELSQQELHRTAAPVFRSSSGQSIIWSSRALMELLSIRSSKNYVQKKKTRERKIIPKSLLPNYYRLRCIIKSKRLAKQRLPYLKALKKPILVKRLSVKHKESKSVQTEFSFITCSCHGSKIENQTIGFEEKNEPFEQEADGGSLIGQEEIPDGDTNKCSSILFAEDEENNIIESNVERWDRVVSPRSDNKCNSASSEIQHYMVSSIPIKPTKYEDEKIEEDESAHNTSGSHTVRVLVHAPMLQARRDSGSIMDDTPDNLPRTPLRPSRSPSLIFDEDLGHRTPPRATVVSPTFTSPLSNISHSSSNKENYDPNRTPVKDTKKPEGKEKKESGTRVPFGVLFETSHIRVACSCLQPVQEALVTLACKRLGWTYCREFDPDLTHLVVAVDGDNRAQRTVKYVCALAAGCWVVSHQWAVQSLTHECLQDEDSFEAVDWSGECGPRRARAARGKLFVGLVFCCLDSITTIRRDILTWILETAGGRVVAAEAATEAAVVLHEPKEEDSADLCSEATAATGVALHYEWALESLARHRLMPPDAFLLQAADPRALAWLHRLCGAETSGDTPASRDSEDFL